MDRSKEPGAIAGPVYLDICATYSAQENAPKVYAGRYGLASKDVTPAQIKAIFDNLAQEDPKNGFTIGVVDDVTNLSLNVREPLITEPAGTVSCKFWGLGSDGTVGANKNSAKIIGDHAVNKYPCQIGEIGIFTINNAQIPYKVLHICSEICNSARMLTDFSSGSRHKCTPHSLRN